MKNTTPPQIKPQRHVPTIYSGCVSLTIEYVIELCVFYCHFLFLNPARQLPACPAMVVDLDHNWDFLVLRLSLRVSLKSGILDSVRRSTWTSIGVNRVSLSKSSTRGAFSDVFWYLFGA